ncbi:MAG TPA: phosphotransferase [Acidimicrobiales bacterium]|nr:phosphotransferase [Acidimicrobiales bacterium]
MTPATSTTFTDVIERLLPAYLGRQRWYAGAAPSTARVVTSETLAPGLEWLLADAGGARYQVVVGLRPAGSAPDFLSGNDQAVIGVVGDEIAFDATYDPDFARALLGLVAPGEKGSLVRPMGAEQSNTSLVIDDRLVLKVFRRLHDGANPDVEIPHALAILGFSHVATPVGIWRRDGVDLAVCVNYLAGGAEGWALALTSLRDLYATGVDDPAGAGGDLGAEAGRLGQVTAALHLALAEAFGASDGDTAAWAAGVESQLSRLDDGDVDPVQAKEFVDRLRSIDHPGASIRVHGDYHLGQVMRTDAGWFVLDFEGEPARPLEERRRPSSPFKDVAGMLRSFQYATAVALSERDQGDQERLAPLGEAWEQRNRLAFLRGYLGTEGIDALLPEAGPDRSAVLAAFEFDKAVYEVLYERAHRPAWVDIPLRAVRRLLDAQE